MEHASTGETEIGEGPELRNWKREIYESAQRQETHMEGSRGQIQEHR